MSDEPRQEQRSILALINWYVAAWIAVPIILLGVLLYLTLLKPAATSDDNSNDQVGSQENPLAQARASLGRLTDLETCRGAIGRLNEHLNTNPTDRPKRMEEKAVEVLKAHKGITKEDRAEAENNTFTALDAHHLHSCLLFRDAARSLEVGAALGEKNAQTALGRAALGFNWVMRQVYLREKADSGQASEVIPPALVLRRGWGSALERALVFLALIDQFNLQDEEKTAMIGCLLFVPTEKGPKFWACGIVGPKPDDIYLFDPRLGLALPGPEGKGIATLAAVCKDDKVLAQLHVDKLRYDVTSKDAKTAQVLTPCSLSSLAPRMALLETKLLRVKSYKGQALPQPVGVNLAMDLVATLNTLRKGAASAGSGVKVDLWPEGMVLLRRFLPPSEGGTDKGRPLNLYDIPGFLPTPDPRFPIRPRLVGPVPRQEIFRYEQVDWLNFPEVFRDPEQFRYDLGPGEQIRRVFMNPFFKALEQGQPRDLVLRGQFTRAVPLLVREHDEWVAQDRRRSNASYKRQDIVDWAKSVIDAYAETLRGGDDPDSRAKYEKLWKWSQDTPIAIEMGGSMGRGMGAWSLLQLGYCNHEQAVRMQARAELSMVATKGEMTEKTKAALKDAWGDARNKWGDFLEQYPNSPAAPLVRRLRGDTEARLGKIADAQASWRNLTGVTSDVEKLGRLWLAKQAGEK